MKWLKNKIIGILMSFYGVEKNIFSSKNSLEENINIISEKDTGTLMHSLKNNIITQEVLNLKWRTYKILKASEGLSSEIIGYDEDNLPIVKTKTKNNKRGLKKITLDDADNFPLEMVINNDEIVLSGSEAMDNEHISILDEVIHNKSNIGDSVTHGVIDSDEYFITSKTERPIKISRENLPNFYIENFTKKMNIRKISKDKRLLEFYVSKYHDEYNRTSRLFISSLKKLMENQPQTMTEISEVEFITYKSIGVDDYLEYKYKIENFDKIIEFNGFYVIKFIANVVVNGKDIFDEHKVLELDKKYEEKAKK